MKIIFHIQNIIMHRKYELSMLFIMLYKFISIAFSFIVLYVWGLVLCTFINLGYLTQSEYEQLAVIIVLLFNILIKKEKQDFISPYITKMVNIEIQKYMFTRELFSIYNFMVIILILPSLFLSKIPLWSIEACVSLFISFFLIGLLLNLFSKIVKWFCKNAVCFIITLIGLFVYMIILVISHQFDFNVTLSMLFSNYYSIILCALCVLILMPFYMYIIRQELYQIYEIHNNGSFILQLFSSESMQSNLFSKLYFRQFARCNGFRNFLTPIMINIFAGLFLYLILDFNKFINISPYLNFKMIGLSIYLGSYTIVMVPFTIYSNSNYFDTIYSKPISIKSLLLDNFYMHVCITSVLFMLLLTYIAIFDNQNVLPFITLYLFTLGPMAFILFLNILFANKYDLYSSKSGFSIERTLAQKIIGYISGMILLGAIVVINAFSTTGCFIVIISSTIVIIFYNFWIKILYKCFMSKKYRIMENLRK